MDKSRRVVLDLGSREYYREGYPPRYITFHTRNTLILLSTRSHIAPIHQSILTLTLASWNRAGPQLQDNNDDRLADWVGAIIKHQNATAGYGTPRCAWSTYHYFYIEDDSSFSGAVSLTLTPLGSRLDSNSLPFP